MKKIEKIAMGIPIAKPICKDRLPVEYDTSLKLFCMGIVETAPTF